MLWKGVLQHNLSLWEESQREHRDKAESADLFGIDWAKALSPEIWKDPHSAVRSIIALVSSKGIGSSQIDELWTWTQLPFAVRQLGLSLVSAAKKATQNAPNGLLISDLDRWVVENEAYLRFLSRKAAALQPESETVRQWTFGLVPLDQLHIVLSQPHLASTVSFTIQRPEAMPGYAFLDDNRKETLYTQGSQQAFNRRWSSITNNVLNGLQWANVFAAGGLILGTLLTPEVDAVGAHQEAEWISSDIDLYLWGLTPEEANEKIKHVGTVYQANLPPGSEFLAVRNSQTITFYSSWPTKRVQIILKLVNSPREVLLNFDLDPCTVGYDGKNVWMLPRFVRALETGYSAFSMDMINGHYLGDRKATRESRVFKYADKGFGIHISPHHVTALKDRARGRSPSSLEDIDLRAKEWTWGVINLENSKQQMKNLTNPSAASRSSPEDQRCVVSQSLLDHYLAHDQPKRCLASFPLFMRHVSFWEELTAGNICVQKGEPVDAATEEDQLQNYDDTPKYIWNEAFDIPSFRNTIRDFNRSLADKFEDKAHTLYFWPYSDALLKVRRISCGDTVSDILSPEKDLYIPLVLPKDLVTFANKTIEDVIRDGGFDDSPPVLTVLYEDQSGSKHWGPARGNCLVVWRLSMRLMNWQMMDRRLDELREILWDFHRRFAAGEWVSKDADFQERSSGQEGMDSFINWVTRRH
ncbi:hypothetical protein V5O48_003782 [Marasmius crinis-equi]|uniref:Uncharacterized protein n=1 Tax=Marasmius crinis-equi TaxID=585013 RepID=A0ABR3FRY6_9AGAR